MRKGRCSMSENVVVKKRRRIRHRGRAEQVWIYLGKQLRFFINESDWKVLPMAAVIAALVAMVIRNKFFVNMEGGLIGSFALCCVAIWNGCFNSIQAVCRERAIIKREHRSGMHISSYVVAHMIYQFLLCAAQTVVTMYVLKLVGVKFPNEGSLVTGWMILDIGLSMFLISYASDMLSLFISSICHTTTSAMTIMPFVLIFQLVFSGGIIPLPAWSQSLSKLTISNYGVKAIASQSGYNEMPMETGWKTLVSMRDKEFATTVTVGQILDALGSPAMDKYRDQVVLRSVTVGEVTEMLNSADETLRLREKEIVHPVTLREVLTYVQGSSAMEGLREKKIPLLGNMGITFGDAVDKVLGSEEMQSVLDEGVRTTVSFGKVLDILQADGFAEENGDVVLNQPVTLGQIIDLLRNNEVIQGKRDFSFDIRLSVGDILEIAGEERVKELVMTKTADAARKPEYDRTLRNIAENWIWLGIFIFLFAAMATISLELIDKDKR